MTTKISFKVVDKNEAWILHREEMETIQDGSCNIYVLMDAYTGYCFGQEICVDLPSSTKIMGLLKVAQSQAKRWPQKMLILKKDPFAETFAALCTSMKIPFEEMTAKELQPYVKPFKDSFRQFKKGPPVTESVGTLSPSDQEELEAFIPESYSPCPCASGHKFKFCCQKIFKDITFAMCAAQDGHLEDALKYMKSAEEKAGRTAEVLCRTAICWSFYDLSKTRLLLAEALKLNPNHPRANYVCGIEAKAAEDFEQAVVFYQRAIENYPPEDKFHLNETYNNLGTVFFELKKYKEAKESWEKALVLWPTDHMVLENLFEFIYNNPDIPKTVRGISPFIKKYLDRKTVSI